VGNEENEYPIHYPTRTMITITNELNHSQKKSLKEEIMGEITEILIENL
jgi:hypothetical protein